MLQVLLLLLLFLVNLPSCTAANLAVFAAAGACITRASSFHSRVADVCQKLWHILLLLLLLGLPSTLLLLNPSWCCGVRACCCPGCCHVCNCCPTPSQPAPYPADVVLAFLGCLQLKELDAAYLRRRLSWGDAERSKRSGKAAAAARCRSPQPASCPPAAVPCLPLPCWWAQQACLQLLLCCLASCPPARCTHWVPGRAAAQSHMNVLAQLAGATCAAAAAAVVAVSALHAFTCCWVLLLTSSQA
ncbi:hypothetical protein COO60DRAFT_671390 [Scenedesmus sp. NREL 46B-D3]|nr:hypothetical protein COO60DRAFT_671390 [Scenedesmus sp. NREL 46B-D3]